MSIAALVLAAGHSRRMGNANKLLLPLGGRPLVAWGVEAALASRADPVLVVTGYQAETVEAALAGYPVRLVRNPDAGDGLSSSLRRGLEALPAGARGVLVCLGDMPGVTAAHLNTLIAAFAGEEDVCVPTLNGQWGNPVLWGRHHVPALMALTGDAGGRRLLPGLTTLREVPFPDDGIAMDVDNQEEYSLLARNKNGKTGEPALPLAEGQTGLFPDLI